MNEKSAIVKNGQKAVKDNTVLSLSRKKTDFIEKDENQDLLPKPNITSLKKLLQKKYRFLGEMPEKFTNSFGDLTENFIMLIWGQSANGKSNFIMQLLSVLIQKGTILYISLEEGTEATMQNLAKKNFNIKQDGRIKWADSTMTYDVFFKYMIGKRRQLPFKYIVIDSVQYWDICYRKYRKLKEVFPTKSFIFISHDKAGKPDGTTADKIRYDAPIKVHVEGFIATVKSRFGGNAPYVIWEDGAKNYWGKDYKKKIQSPHKHLSKIAKHETNISNNADNSTDASVGQ